MKWRRFRIRFVSWIGVVLFLLAAGFLAPSFSSPSEVLNLPDFPNFIFWEYDEEEAFKIAEKEKGIIFTYFYSNDCDTCQQMERETFSSAEVIQFSRDHVFLKLNAKTSKMVIEKYQVTKIPTLILLSHSGREIFRESAFLSPSQLLEKVRRSGRQPSNSNFQKGESLSFYLNYAKKAFQHLEFFEATKALDFILYKDPGNEQGLNDEALLLFGTCLVYLYQLEGAEVLLARLCKEYPYSERVPDAMYILGEIYAQTRRINLGTNLLEKLVKDYPGHPMEQRARMALERIKKN